MPEAPNQPISSIEDIQAQLRALRNAFAADLPGRVEELAEAWASDAPDRLARVHFLAHRLAGTTGTFGFSATCGACRALEAWALAPGDPVQGGRHLEAVRAAAASELSGPNCAWPDPARLPSAPPAETEPLVLVAGRVPEDRDALADAATPFGYHTLNLGSLDELVAALSRERPAAVLVDSDFQPEDPWTSDGFKALVAGAQPLPVLFATHRGDIEARLRAVRLGGVAFLQKPVDPITLVDRLDQACARQPAEPYTVVLVEDEPSVAAHHALVLEQAGMRVHKVVDPLQVLDVLREVQADLIAIDIYMPQCTGTELAALIRQQETFVGLPIVYLSGEQNVDLQMEAMRQGGDDFLMKPIEPQHLVAALAHRARRGRVLRSFMVRDSLTGLLNHTALKGQLEQEAARARRQGGAFTFAMIDIDHFKKVNDTWGHGTGDRVIKALARTLMQRLRKTDILGRYGGEEFAAILTDTDLATAERVMDGIRASFQEMRFRVGDQEFGCSFSCGLAAFPAFGTTEALSTTADEALYEAKRQGRNRVKAVGPR